MVNLVDRFVKWAPVKSTMREVVPSIFHHEEDRDLIGHCPDRGEGDRSGETTELSHGMEKPAKCECVITRHEISNTLHVPDLG